MDPSQTTTVPGDATRQGGEPDLAAQVKEATFPTVMRGYDKDEVDRFLAWLAKRLEGVAQLSGGGIWGPDALRRELERVGESTKGILAAAEETARKLRADTAREVEEARRSAREQAQRMRSEAEEFASQTRESASEEARRLRVEASREAEEAIATAQAKAEEQVDTAVRRHRALEARIERLLERRDRVVDHLGRLSQQLSALASAAEKEQKRSLEEDDAEGPGDAEGPPDDGSADGEELALGSDQLHAALGDHADLDREVDAAAGAGDPDATKESGAPGPRFMPRGRVRS